MSEARSCEACGSSSTYAYEGRPAWHKTPTGFKCHRCYSASYNAKKLTKKQAYDAAFEVITNGGEPMTSKKEAIQLLEMKCANQSCENMIYISGASAMSIDDIKAFCSDCSITSTYKKASMKSTYVKRIVDGQLRLDESLQKEEKDE